MTTSRGSAACLLLAALAVLVLPLPLRAADVVFGQVASVTNPASATNARGLIVGINAGFESINARGGVNGHRLKLSTLDDGLQGPRMVELTGQLVKDPAIVGLLGFLNTAGITALAKDDAFAKGGVALIAPLQGDKAIVGATNIFPLRSGYADEVDALLKETKSWDKDTLAIVNMNIAFGPSLAELAAKRAADAGIKVVSRSVVSFNADAIAASVKAAVETISANRPKAILLLAAGAPATEFIKAVRVAPGGLAQIYGLSVLLHGEVVKAAGANKARGIVLSQAIPYPFVPSRPVITEYQRAMAAHTPNEPLSFASLEGYLGARIAAEAVRRCGGTVTRASLLAALRSLGEFNMGGLYVNYSPQARKGWGGVDLSIINAGGNLQK